MLSTLELVNQVDSWPYYYENPAAYKEKISEYYYFMMEEDDKPVGYVHSSLMEDLGPFHVGWTVHEEQRLLRLAAYKKHATDIVYRTLKMLHERGKLGPKGSEKCIAKWNEETFAVYSSTGDHLMDMVSQGVDIFGVVSHQVNMIIYTKTKGGLRYWVRRRSADNTICPNMLDSSVGGPIPYKIVYECEWRDAKELKPTECIIQKAKEQVGILEPFTRLHARSCGTLSYRVSQTDDGRACCQYQVQFLYEMEISKPEDVEVQGFSLMSREEIQEALGNGEFKPTSAMTWIAFLIRHGFINAGNEPNLVEICSRLHRKVEMFIA